jgi:hypothetical protein
MAHRFGLGCCCACSSAVGFTTDVALVLQSDCPIAKEASPTPVDLTTLNPMQVVLCCDAACLGLSSPASPA